MRHRIPTPRTKLIGQLVVLMATLSVGAEIAAQEVSDRVVIRNGSGEKVLLLVKGTLAGTYVNDKDYLGEGTEITIGNFTPSGRVDEVVAFTRGRPIAINTPVRWTTGTDVVDIEFADEIRIPVTAWILKAPFADHRDRAQKGSDFATKVWNGTMAGVGFSDFEIRDATAHPAARKYLDFRCQDHAEGIQQDIGKIEGRINVYYVDRVTNQTDGADTCGVGSSMAALGSEAKTRILVHELGHNFNLPEAPPPLDPSNVMRSLDGAGNTFTGGQLFRAHFCPNSTLNYLYNARPGQPTRSCPPNVADDYCPNLTWPNPFLETR